MTTSASQPDPDSIHEQCRRLCDNRAFKASERLRRLLRHLVTRTLEQRQRTLTQRQLATEVFERKEDFDPEQDAIVRIEMGKLRQALQLFYADSSRQDGVIITIPKGTYVPAFTWGKKSAADNKEPVSRTGIAVLPLHDLSESEDESWLTDGLREELILLLNRIPELAVASRHTLQRFIDANSDMISIQRELGVRFFLEGSVRRAGNRLRVNVRLYDIKQDLESWNERYDRDLNTANLLDIQDDIAQQVVSQSADLFTGKLGRSLRSELGVEAESDIRVYEAILRFHQYLHQLTGTTWAAARVSLEQATHLEPDNPLVLSMLGDLLRAGFCFGFSDAPDPTEMVLEIQRRAISMAPDCLPCRISLGYTLLKMGERERLRQLTDEIINDSTAPSSYRTDAAVLAAFSGDWDRGCALLRRQLDTVQGHPAYFAFPLLLDAYRRRDYREALDLAHDFKPTGLFWLPLLKAACLGQLGQTEAARMEVGKLLELRVDFPVQGRRYLACILPQHELVEHLLEGLRQGGLACE